MVVFDAKPYVPPYFVPRVKLDLVMRSRTPAPWMSPQCGECTCQVIWNCPRWLEDNWVNTAMWLLSSCCNLDLDPKSMTLGFCKLSQYPEHLCQNYENPCRAWTVAEQTHIHNRQTDSQTSRAETISSPPPFLWGETSFKLLCCTLNQQLYVDWWYNTENTYIHFCIITDNIHNI